MLKPSHDHSGDSHNTRLRHYVCRSAGATTSAQLSVGLTDVEVQEQFDVPNKQVKYIMGWYAKRPPFQIQILGYPELQV